MFRPSPSAPKELTPEETKALFDKFLTLEPQTSEKEKSKLLDKIICKGTGPFSAYAIETMFEKPLANATCSAEKIDLFEDMQNLIETAKIKSPLVGFYLDTLYQIRVLELPELVAALEEDEESTAHFIRKVLEGYFVFVNLIEKCPDDYAALCEIKSPFTPLQLLDEMLFNNQILKTSELAGFAQATANDVLEKLTLKSSESESAFKMAH